MRALSRKLQSLPDAPHPRWHPRLADTLPIILRWRLSNIGVLAIVVALAPGCGGGGDSALSDHDQIAAVLDQLRQTQDTGDAETACSDVYVIREAEPGGGEDADAESSNEGEGSGGEGEESSSDCETAFRAADAQRREEVSDLKTETGAIEVDGDSATAIVHTTLQRQDGSVLDQDVPYDLVRTPEGWRVRIANEG